MHASWNLKRLVFNKLLQPINHKDESITINVTQVSGP